VPSSPHLLMRVGGPTAVVINGSVEEASRVLATAGRRLGAATCPHGALTADAAWSSYLIGR
jgi:hypothetical protein